MADLTALCSQSSLLMLMLGRGREDRDQTHRHSVEGVTQDMPRK